jgi:hypothetical protein
MIICKKKEKKSKSNSNSSLSKSPHFYVHGSTRQQKKTQGCLDFLESHELKGHPQTCKQGIIYEAQQDGCCFRRDI